MGTESLESPGLFPPPTLTPTSHLRSLLIGFQFPGFQAGLFILIATRQNKSLMNQLVGRAISSRLPPGSGGGVQPGPRHQPQPPQEENGGQALRGGRVTSVSQWLGPRFPSRRVWR